VDSEPQRLSLLDLIVDHERAAELSKATSGDVAKVMAKRRFSIPRALELHEIPGIIEEFRSGAERALRAGFDGVEIHGANGYLPDQFLQDGTNKRTDEYGGPIENRARFLLEVTQAAISAWGADRVGVRISPSCTYGSMSDSDPPATFGYVATELDRLGIAYLHVVEPRIKGTVEISHLRPKFSRTFDRRRRL
jgi:N-ethylmaleimide reductase